MTITASGKLLRVAKSGGAISSVLAQAAVIKPGMAIDGTHLYYGTFTGADLFINRVPLGASSATPEVLTKHTKAGNSREVGAHHGSWQSPQTLLDAITPLVSTGPVLNGSDAPVGQVFFTSQTVRPEAVSTILPLAS